MSYIPDMDAIQAIAEQIRHFRKQEGLTQSDVAGIAGMTRQKIVDIEKGKPGVAIAAYVAVMEALDLDWTFSPRGVVPADYPQLRLLAWNRNPARRVSEKDALALYERNWDLVDEAALTPRERELIQHLVTTHGNGVLHV